MSRQTLFKNFKKNFAIEPTIKPTQKSVKKTVDKSLKHKTNIVPTKTKDQDQYTTPVINFDIYNIDYLHSPNIQLIKRIIESKYKGQELVEWSTNTLPDTRILPEEFVYWTINNLTTCVHTLNLEWPYSIFSVENYGTFIKHLLQLETEHNNTNIVESQYKIIKLLYKHAESLNFTKINHKNAQIYILKLLFQLFYVNECIDENIYIDWLNWIETSTNAELIEHLTIQTGEFFIVIKNSLDANDEETNSDDIDDIFKKPLDNHIYPDSNSESDTDSDTETETDDNIKPPFEAFLEKPQSQPVGIHKSFVNKRNKNRSNT